MMLNSSHTYMYIVSTLMPSCGVLPLQGRGMGGRGRGEALRCIALRCGAVQGLEQEQPCGVIIEGGEI